MTKRPRQTIFVRVMLIMFSSVGEGLRVEELTDAIRVSYITVKDLDNTEKRKASGQSRLDSVTSLHLWNEEKVSVLSGIENSHS